ncbi:MAG TPA: DUF1360 domain-containing protein [Candidatus Limnocylindria bacterium]|nr:DUF1360 domain-containing protein [Candidatus Limnocylindria bacterium]
MGGRPDCVTDRNGLAGRVLKTGLITAFLTGVGVLGRGPYRDTTRLTDVTLTALAAHRIGRMLAYERVAEPIREPFTATVTDASGVDETVVARGTGMRWVIGELVSCPLCVATWASLALTAGRRFLPGPTQVLVRVLAIAGLAELNYSVVERLEWSARAARRKAA